MISAKLKAPPREAAARAVDDLWNTVRDALLQFAPSECANHFAAAGHKPD